MSTTPPSRTGNDERDDALLRFALREMSDAEARDFAQRMEDDAELAAEARALRDSFDLMGHAAVTDPPAALRARVLEAATRPPTKVIRPTRWLGRAALAAVAASIVLVLGLDDYRLRRELDLLREVNETLHQPNVVVSFSLRGTADTAGAFGKAILDLDAKKAAMVVSGLPALDEGQAYWLWAMVGEEAVPCGRFEATGDARIVRQFAIPVQEYTEPVRQLILTIEPAEGADRPEGPTVMTSV